jgi:IS30 family transposase
MDNFDRNLDALDYQIAFFTTLGLNGAEVAKQLEKNKSTINRQFTQQLADCRT